MRPLAQEEPREQSYEDDLRITEDGGEAGPDLLDAVVPEDQVGGEERSGDPCERERAAPLAAVALALPPREQPERREGKDAAVERAGRRGDVGEAEENARERNRYRADEHGQYRPLADA